MIPLKVLLRVTLILGIVVIGVSILDFLALHDIRKDYVSQQAISSLKITSMRLPTHTQTTSEWLMVSFSYFSKLLFLILNSIVLVMGLRYLKQKPQVS